MIITKNKRRTSTHTIVLNTLSDSEKVIRTSEHKNTTLITTANLESVDKWFKREYDKLISLSNKDKNGELQQALKVGDISRIVELYNTALASIPYDDFAKNRNEFWYRSMFMMLLRGADVISYAEVHTHRGRSDLVIPIQDGHIVLEFKLAKRSSEIEQKIKEGINQMVNKKYTKGYKKNGHRAICAVIVANDEKRQVNVQIISTDNTQQS